MSASANPKPEIRHPEITVRLIGIDGNAYAILGAVRAALRTAGHADEVAVFLAEATSGDYAHLLATCMRWVTVHRERLIFHASHPGATAAHHHATQGAVHHRARP